MIPQQAMMKDALNEARCSNKLLEHLEHLHETKDLFGNVAKSQGQCQGILNGRQCRDTETRRGCSQTDTVSVETRSRLSSAFSDRPPTFMSYRAKSSATSPLSGCPSEISFENSTTIAGSMRTVSRLRAATFKRSINEKHRTGIDKIVAISTCKKNCPPIILFAGNCRQSASKLCANPIETRSAGRGTLPRLPRTISVGRLTSHSSLSSHVFPNCRHG
jgi:hypothetical protein